MSPRKVARLLGLTRYEVEVITEQALAKFRKAWGLPTDLGTSTCFSRVGMRRQKKCGRCGEPGHQANTCARRTVQ